MRVRMGGMKHRKLRIAWSVAWGALVLLLVALWVRSYWAYDRFIGRHPNGLIAYSNKGVYIFSTYPLLAPDVNVPWWFLVRRAQGMAVCLPFSLTVAVACAVSTAPWIRWRFSLRTLLVATTLIAIGLGLAIYAARK